MSKYGPDKHGRCAPRNLSAAALVALVLALVSVALAAVPGADASGFRLVGDVRPHHFAWLRAAQVPLPPLTVTLVLDRGPFYEPGSQTAFVPKAGRRGWTYADERLLFFHELGHAFDYALLRPADRVRFRGIAATTCRWWQNPCRALNARCGCGQILNVAPGEMFAEAYAALALGMTRAQVDDAGLPTYGWNPPAEAEAVTRALLEEIASR
jgi:hypothetical protein